MNTIHNIIKKELITETAGISFVVRKWAKILIQEVEDQNTAFQEKGLKKSEAKESTHDTQLHNRERSQSQKEYDELTDPYNLGTDLPDTTDPFYWEDENSKGSGSKGGSKMSDHDYNDDFFSNYSYMSESSRGERRRLRKARKQQEKMASSDDPQTRSEEGYYKKSYNKEKKDATPEKKKWWGGSSNKGKFSSGYSYGGYTYTPSIKEVIVLGEKYPEEYAEFAVDKWVLKDSTRTEYDHWTSGYDAEGKYVVYLNVSIPGVSEVALIHETKHAYDDWNRMRHGGKPIRDSWEIKNVYTKDFERLILGGALNFPQLGPIIKMYYHGSKLEAPAYMENEYDNAIIDYEEIGKKLKSFTTNRFFNKKGEPSWGLEREFKEIQEKYDIPLLNKFDNVKEFLAYTKKYFNQRGEDIFRRVAKMRYVHQRPAKVKYTPSTYYPSVGGGGYGNYYKPTPISDEPGDDFGGWKYSKEKGWEEVDVTPEPKRKKDYEVKYKPTPTTYYSGGRTTTPSEPATTNYLDFDEGEEFPGWKYSADKGWHYVGETKKEEPEVSNFKSQSNRNVGGKNGRGMSGYENDFNDYDPKMD